MAATTGEVFVGTKLEYDSDFGNTPVWTEIIEITDMDGPNQEVTDVELSHSQSPSKHREYKAGMVEPGVLTVNGNWTKAKKALVRSLLGTTTQFRMTFPDASTEIFGGYVKSDGYSGDLDSSLSEPISVKASGTLNFTAAP